MIEVTQGTLFWLTIPDEVQFRNQVDHEKYVYRVTAWPLPSWPKLMKIGVFVAPKQDKK